MKKQLLFGICATSIIPLQSISAQPVEDPAWSQPVPSPADSPAQRYEAGTGAPEPWGPPRGGYDDRGGYGALPGSSYDRRPQSSYGGYRYGYGYRRRSGEPPRGYQYGYSYGSDAPPQGYWDEYTHGPETPSQGSGYPYGPQFPSYGYGPPAGYGVPPAYGDRWGAYPQYGPDTGYGEVPYAPESRDFRAGVPRGAPPGYGAPQPYRDEWQGAPSYGPGTPDAGGAYGGYPGGYAPPPYPRGPVMPGGDRGVGPGMVEEGPAGSYPYAGGWERPDRFRGYPPLWGGYDDEYVPPPLPQEPAEMAPATPAGVLPPASEDRLGPPSGNAVRGAEADAAAARPLPDLSRVPAADAGQAVAAPQDESIKAEKAE